MVGVSLSEEMGDDELFSFMSHVAEVAMWISYIECGFGFNLFA